MHDIALKIDNCDLSMCFVFSGTYLVTVIGNLARLCDLRKTQLHTKKFRV